jgi:tRNA-dihydrouridine synthase B
VTSTSCPAIIRAVAGAISIPTTVKIRSGWNDEQRNPVGSGCAARMRARRCSRCTRAPHADVLGSRDWDEIARPWSKRSTFRSSAMAMSGRRGRARMREHTGCAGIMIARGSHGAPWIFAQARAALDGRCFACVRS